MLPAMLVGLLIRIGVTAAAFAVTAWLLEGMDVSGGVFGYLWVAILFGLINAIIGTIVRILTLPLTLITLGLFAVIINAALLELTDAITSHLTIDEFFWTAIWAAIILAISTVVIEIILGALIGRPGDDAAPART